MTAYTTHSLISSQYDYQDNLLKNYSDHLTPLLKPVKLLPILFRARNKLPSMIYKALQDLESCYLIVTLITLIVTLINTLFCACSF